jgi:hypothetical protein
LSPGRRGTGIDVCRGLQRPAPGTGEDLIVEDGPPEGALPNDLPPQADVFAPDYEPKAIAEIAQPLALGCAAQSAFGQTVLPRPHHQYGEGRSTSQAFRHATASTRRTGTRAALTSAPMAPIRIHSDL